MNRIIGVIVAAACAAPSVTSQAAGCTNADLAGAYGYQTSGWFTPAPGQPLAPFSETGQFDVAADGTLSGAGAFAFGGQTGGHTFTGSFEVSADCSATAAASDNLGLSAAYKLVILEKGKDFLIQNVSPGYVIQGRAERQKVGAPKG